MNIISLSFIDLSVAAVLVLILASISAYSGLGMGKQIILNAIRMTLQLMLIGIVLKTLFEYDDIEWVGAIAMVMLVVAGREVMARQKYSFKGWWGYGVVTASMFISSFTLTLFALKIIIEIKPWYEPQYSIPLLGMMFGNTMNGIALGMERLTSESWRQRKIIEERLMLGQDWKDAIGHIRKESMHTAMTPIINAMAAAGIVSLPGMMTGQILAGSPPLEAVKYQILIMFLITVGTGFGVLSAVWIGSQRLFDVRHRLRLDRLQPPRHR